MKQTKEQNNKIKYKQLKKHCPLEQTNSSWKLLFFYNIRAIVKKKMMFLIK